MTFLDTIQYVSLTSSICHYCHLITVSAHSIIPSSRLYSDGIKSAFLQIGEGTTCSTSTIHCHIFILINGVVVVYVMM